MIKTPPLSDDVETLKALLIKQNQQITTLQTTTKSLEKTNTQLKSKVLTLQEQLNLALAKRYAASSEKINTNQLRLFDEAEVDADKSLLDERGAEITTVAKHTRTKKTGRKTLPDNLPRIEVIHELSESERVCDTDGKTLIEIGEVISEQLDIIPAKIQVIRHVRKKYACRCGTCIKTAPLPKQPIPNYNPSRSQTVPLQLLEGFQGALQTDGFAGYNAVVNQHGLIHLGSLAHARRKFTEVIKAQGKNNNKKIGKAQRALNFIQQLYKIEKSLKTVSVDERFKIR